MILNGRHFGGGGGGDELDPESAPASIRRPDGERIALLESEVRHLRRTVDELVKSVRLTERIVITLAITSGVSPLLSTLAANL